MMVLIVDDDLAGLKMLDLNLRKHGFDTIAVDSGHKALEALLNHADIELIVSDIMMPEMNGLQLISAIKEKQEWRAIPIIMCTSMADANIVKQAVDLGCKHYVIKPVNVGQLIDKIKETQSQTKPVLARREEIMKQQNIDDAAYQHLLDYFSKQVNQKKNSLSQAIENSPATLKISNFSELSQTAGRLGAWQLQKAIDDIQGKDFENISEKKLMYQLLAKALEELSGKLPPLNAAASENTGKKAT